MKTSVSYVDEGLNENSTESVSNIEKSCVKELEQMLLKSAVLKTLKEPEVEGWGSSNKFISSLKGCWNRFFRRTLNEKVSIISLAFGGISSILMLMVAVIHEKSAVVSNQNVESIVSSDTLMIVFGFFTFFLTIMSVFFKEYRGLNHYGLNMYEKTAKRFFQNFNVHLFSRKEIRAVEVFGILRSMNESLIAMKDDKRFSLLREKELDTIMESVKSKVLNFPIREALAKGVSYNVENDLGNCKVNIPPLIMTDFFNLNQLEDSESDLCKTIRNNINSTLDRQSARSLKAMTKAIDDFVLLSGNNELSLSEKKEKVEALLTSASVTYLNFYKYLNPTLEIVGDSEEVILSNLKKKMEEELSGNQYKEALLNKVGNI